MGFTRWRVMLTGFLLSDLIGSRHNIFQFMRDMLVDLQTCIAEATWKRRSKARSYSPFLLGKIQRVIDLVWGLVVSVACTVC